MVDTLDASPITATYGAQSLNASTTSDLERCPSAQITLVPGIRI